MPAMGRNNLQSHKLGLRLRYSKGLSHKAGNGHRKLKNKNLMLQEGSCLGYGLWQGDTLTLVLGQQAQKQGVQGPADRCVAQAAQVQVIIHVMVAYGAI